MQAYNADVVLDLIADNLASRGRGSQTRLAEAVGVTVQTVNKWKARQTCPKPDRWPSIESHFGIEPGSLRRASGLPIIPATSPDVYERLTRLEGAVAELRQMIVDLGIPEGAA